MDRADQQPHSELSGPRHATTSLLVWRGILKTAERSSERIKSVKSDEFAAWHAKARQPQVASQLPQPRTTDERRGTEGSLHQLLCGQGERNDTVSMNLWIQILYTEMKRILLSIAKCNQRSQSTSSWWFDFLLTARSNICSWKFFCVFDKHWKTNFAKISCQGFRVFCLCVEKRPSAHVHTRVLCLGQVVTQNKFKLLISNRSFAFRNNFHLNLITGLKWPGAGK